MGGRIIRRGGGGTLPTGINIRDLGGWPTPDGPVRSNRFLRSASLEGIGRRGVRQLVSYGVACDLDLRGPAELREWPDPLAAVPDVRYLNVPLFDVNVSDSSLSRCGDEDDYYAGIYLDMLANREAVRRMFAFMASVGEDCCVLFHCSAGMDRTGITAMLLEGLAGVSRDDVMRDYLRSFGTRDEVERELREEPGAAGPSPLWALPMRHRTIATVYDRVIGVFGSAGAYLLGCGVTKAQLHVVRRHLLEPGTSSSL